MIWYGFAEIMQAYDISKEGLKYMVKKGKIESKKLYPSNYAPDFFKYIIPASELPKLERFRTGKIKFRFDSQPDYVEERKAKEREERRKRDEELREYEEKYGDEASHRLFRKKYYEYLKSDEFRPKRMAALERDGYQCQMCGSGKNLCVHHITYDHLHKPEEIDDLITLCNSCHLKVHLADLSGEYKEERGKLLLFRESEEGIITML